MTPEKISSSEGGPVRVQRSRARGSRIPPNTVYVGRPGPWGNPYVVGTPGIPDAATAVALYREWAADWDSPGHPAFKHSREALDTLRGKNLACWCAIGEPCHADVLLELANSRSTG